MFDFLSKGPTTKATTTNQQVGVQGTGAIGASGTIKGAQAVAGSTAIGPITIKGNRAGKGGSAGTSLNITTTTTDPQAFAAIRDIASKSSDVAMQTVNASHQTVINALSTLQNVAGESIAANAAIATQAAPVSEGNISLATSSAATKVLLAAVVVVGIVGAIYVYRQYNT